MKKIGLDKQLEAVKACLVAEEIREAAKVARGELTEQQATDGIEALRAAVETMEYLHENRRDFLDFQKSQMVQAGR